MNIAGLEKLKYSRAEEPCPLFLQPHHRRRRKRSSDDEIDHHDDIEGK